MINSLFSNPNMDDPANNREERIRQINDDFNQAIEYIRNPKAKREQQIDWNSPWWSAAKRNLQKTRIKYGLDDVEGEQASKLINFSEKHQERVKNKLDNMSQLDQYN
jgi:hypothetical protein